MITNLHDSFWHRPADFRAATIPSAVGGSTDGQRKWPPGGTARLVRQATDNFASITNYANNSCCLPVNELALAEYMGEIERCGRLPEVHLRWFRFRAGGGSGHGGDLKAKLSEGYGARVPHLSELALFSAQTLRGPLIRVLALAKDPGMDDRLLHVATVCCGW